MSKKEKSNVPKSLLEKILGTLAIFEVIFIWIYLGVSWSGLPSKMPTHFNFAGEVDAWGSKGSLLLVPIIFTILYFVLVVVSKFPQSFNYAVEITKENKERQYKNACEMMAWLTFYIATLALYIEFQSIQVANGNSGGLGFMFVIIEMVAIFGTLGFYIYRMIKLK